MEAITILNASSTVTRRDDGILISSVTDLLLNLGIIEQLHLFIHTLKHYLHNEQKRTKAYVTNNGSVSNLSIHLARGIAATVEKVSFMLVKDDPADRSSHIIWRSLNTP